MAYKKKGFAHQWHLVGQAVLDNIDARHKSILSPTIWGDGNPEGVTRGESAKMKNTARAAQKLGVGVVNGFTVWHLIYDFPPTPKSTFAAAQSSIILVVTAMTSG